MESSGTNKIACQCEHKHVYEDISYIRAHIIHDIHSYWNQLEPHHISYSVTLEPIGTHATNIHEHAHNQTKSIGQCIMLPLHMMTMM
jgi:hypothetical protein